MINHFVSPQCERDGHGWSTCKAAQQDRSAKLTLETGADTSLMQSCPFCDKLWDRPINCLHATCEMGSLSGGCGQQFCYLCAAPYLPIKEHGNAYHRPQCDLYTPCCSQNCSILEKGCKQCVEVKYLPGACVLCRNTTTHNTTTHNTCTHSDWRACRSCITR